MLSRSYLIDKVALTQNRTDHMSVTIRDLLVTLCDLLSNKVCSSGLRHVLAQIHGKLIEYMSIVVIYQCMNIITGYIKYEHTDATRRDVNTPSKLGT